MTHTVLQKCGCGATVGKGGNAMLKGGGTRYVEGWGRREKGIGDETGRRGKVVFGYVFGCSAASQVTLDS